MTTKIHLAADQRCRPVAFVTSEGQRHDSIAFETVLAKVRIDPVGPGRPRTTVSLRRPVEPAMPQAADKVELVGCLQESRV